MEKSTEGYKAKVAGIEQIYEYIVVIGTSTGGPEALRKLLTTLPKELPAVYVIVQHMPAGFTLSLAKRLDSLSQIEVKEAENGEILTRGVAYIAPGGKQLRVMDSLLPKVVLSDEESYKSHRPSVNVMISSVAKLKTTKKIIGIIMTGMGKDGLEGIRDLKQKKGTKVIIEAESSCVIYGMPRAVASEKLHDYEVPIDQIGKVMIEIMGV